MTPTPVSPSSPAKTERLVCSLLGTRLVSVRYRYLEVEDDADYRSALPDVDTDLALVVLEFTGGRSLVVAWAISGNDEGLNLGEGPPGPELGPAAPEADVTTRRGWDRLVGRELLGAAGSWYSGGDAKTLWSLRLDVGDRSAVIALGGPSEGALKYEADELVVIFDAATAQTYRPEQDDDSAWGSPICVA
jgi:hypothetical protein